MRGLCGKTGYWIRLLCNWNREGRCGIDGKQCVIITFQEEEVSMKEKDMGRTRMKPPRRTGEKRKDRIDKRGLGTKW